MYGNKVNINGNSKGTNCPEVNKSIIRGTKKYPSFEKLLQELGTGRKALSDRP